MVCSNSPTAAVAFTTPNSGGTLTYTWTNDQPSIGLSGTGSGDIPSFTALNIGTSPVVATIIVTPHFENGSFTCDGPTKIFTITVNPTAQVELPVNQVVCNNVPTQAVILSTINTGGTTTYTWTNDLTSIGLAASGTGDIPSFTGVNISNDPVIATITVTPHFENGLKICDGPSHTFTITVDPTPQVVPSTLTQTICNNGVTNILVGSPSTFSSGVVTFNYTVVATGGVTGFTTPVNGLPKDFIIADNLINPTDEVQTVTYTITPVTSTGCASGPATVIVTILPTAQINQPSSQILCNGDNSTLVSLGTLTVGDVTFTWTNDQPAIGLTASGNGDIPSFTAVNTGDSPLIATISVIPHFTFGTLLCDGQPKIFTITVNPIPRISPVPVNPTQCDNTATNITLQSPSTFTSGVVTFNYTATATGGVTGFTASATGLGNNHVITDLLVNPTDGPQTVTYTITPVSPAGCNNGPSVEITVTVNPTPRIFPVPPAIIQCDSTTTNIRLESPSTFTGGVVTFKYTATATGGITGFTASATGLPNGHIIADNLINPTDAPQTVTYHVIPVSPAGCSDGPGIDITVTVNPTPRVYPVPANTIQCDNTATSITLQSPSIFTSGLVTINFTASAPAGLSGFTASATGLSVGHIITDNLINSTDAPLTVTYRLVPVSGVVCNNGPAVEITVTVNPTPRATPVNGKPAICYAGDTQITLNSPTIMTSGEIRFDYTIAYPSGVTGISAPGTDKVQGDVLSFKYRNYNDTIESVFFSITPKVSGLSCPAGNISLQEVQLHPKPVRGITITKPFTCEASTGLAEMEAEISRGANPYSISWTGPVGYTMEDSLVITNLYAGYYTLDVTDNIGCAGDTAINIANLSASARIIPLPVLPNIHISCPGGNDGSARIYVRDGITPPYEYWLVRNDADTLFTGFFSGNYDTGNPSTYKVCTGLMSGTYKLIIRDINGCETYRTGELKEPAPIVVAFEKSNYSGADISCRGYNDGSAKATVTGGNGSYSYLWYSASGTLEVSNNTNLLDSIPAGKYYLQITDLLGCIKIDSVTLIDPPGMVLTGSEMSHSNDNNFQISCFGASDGYIRLTISGGSGNYTYLWAGPDGYSATTKDISGLKAGTYTCTVTDINGCKLIPQPSFTLTQPDQLVIASLLSTSADGSYNISCNGATGSVDVTVTGGGAGSYSYVWSTTDGSGIAAGQQDQNSLTAGTYHLIVTDYNGCITSKDITLTQPPALITDMIPTHITCQVSGFNNGSINLNVSGGIGPYSYNWSTGATVQDISGLTEGKYFVTVTDANGCLKTDSVVINLPPPLTYDQVHSEYNGYNISCNGKSDGSIQINPTSGTPPYIFSWQGPGDYSSSSKDISGPEKRPVYSAYHRQQFV